MRFRKLRIAWSVFWGLACVLLIVFWVRSYWCADLLLVSESKGVVSNHGGVRMCAFNLASPTPQWVISFTGNVEIGPSPNYSMLGFSYFESPSSLLDRIRVPHWFLIVLSVVIGTTPWIRYRFSLRTLLIVTTLVAILLGAIVYATK
jgi:hypothetical protein